MQKVLLVYDDFSEMMETHNGLKKVGFDVVAVTNEMSTADQVISMNPDLVIAAGKGQKVSSLGVGKRLKDLVRWRGKSLLIIPKGQAIRTDDILKVRVDQLLEGPIEFEVLLAQICKMFHLDDRKLLSKLHRSFTEEAEQVTFLGPPAEESPTLADPPEVPITRDPKAPGQKGVADPREVLRPQTQRIHRELIEARSQERQRVQKYLVTATKEPIQKHAGIQRRDARHAAKELAKDLDDKELKDLDVERREFVKALFRKKSG